VESLGRRGYDRGQEQGDGDDRDLLDLSLETRSEPPVS
jgi:hypothetical protein